MLPSDFEDLFVTGEERVCSAMLKNLRVAVLWYQYHKYKYNADGSFSDAFIAEICSAPCFAPPEPPTEDE